MMPGVVAQRLRQHPPGRELGALVGGLVAHDQRNPRVAQRIEPGADGERGVDVEASTRSAETPNSPLEVERAGARRRA